MTESVKQTALLADIRKQATIYAHIVLTNALLVLRAGHQIASLVNQASIYTTQLAFKFALLIKSFITL